jgi:hypothetical protein
VSKLGGNENEFLFALGKAEPVTPNEKNVLREASISDCNLVSSCFSNKGLKIHVAVLCSSRNLAGISALVFFQILD